jgi:hypothetical protein
VGAAVGSATFVLLCTERLGADGGDAAVVWAGADVLAVCVGENDRVDEPWGEGERDARIG